MNIRRGFNRLSIAVYFLWLVALFVFLWIETSSARSYYSGKLQDHEGAASSLTIKSSRDAVAEVAASNGPQARSLQSDGSLTLEIKVSDLKPLPSTPLVDIPDIGLVEFPETMSDAEIRQAIPNIVRQVREEEARPAFSEYLLPEQIAEYTKKRDEATIPNAILAAFSSWAGWTLVVLFPLGTYLLLLTTGYTLHWVYRGFFEKKKEQG